MKKVYRLVVMMVAAVAALLTLSVPVDASKMDNRIESSAKKTYVFKTYLQADDIKIKSMDGVVTLTGTVSEESHKSLALETVAASRGSRVWTTGWKSKVHPPLRTRMRGSVRN